MAEIADIENYIAKCALGDCNTFSSLYSATSAKLFGVCLRVSGNQAEAEDALQDAFVKIWRNADRYQVNGLSHITWLITIARNLSIDRLRARNTRHGTGLDKASKLPSMAPGLETLTIAASDCVQIVACISELEPDLSDAVRRAQLEGKTYQELAGRYDVRPNTIRTWLCRSLIKLKRVFVAMTDDKDTQDKMALAAEYGPELLTPSEEKSFENLLAVDPALRDHYAKWVEDFVGLTDDIDDMVPPTPLLGRINTTLFGPFEKKKSPFARFGFVGSAFAGLAVAILYFLHSIKLIFRGMTYQI